MVSVNDDRPHFSKTEHISGENNVHYWLDCGVAEWIIDDTCLVIHYLCLKMLSEFKVTHQALSLKLVGQFFHDLRTKITCDNNA